MREQDLEFNPEYKYAKGGKLNQEQKMYLRDLFYNVRDKEDNRIKKTFNKLDELGVSFRTQNEVIALAEESRTKNLNADDVTKLLSKYAKGGMVYKHKHIPTMTFEVTGETANGYKGIQKDKKSLSKLERTKGKKVSYSSSDLKDLFTKVDFAKGGKTKKFPLAVQRRVEEINEMLPKVNESGDYASTYAGSTMESYIILDKPIQIKGNYVYISEEDSRWGKYGFEKRYNVNDTRDVYESIKGRKALMSDLGIIKRAFTKLLKSEGKMAKGGIAKKSEYISNRDIVSLTHKKGGTKKTLKGSQLVDGAYAKKKIMRKKPTKSDQLSLLNKGGEIVRAYDVNLNSGVGTYAKGGKLMKEIDSVQVTPQGGYLVLVKQPKHNLPKAEAGYEYITYFTNKNRTKYNFKGQGDSLADGKKIFKSVVNQYDMPKKMARGGKMQGYNAQLDESLGMRRGAKRTKQQSDKDRRDESKAMSKSMDRRAYAGVRGMDKGRRKMAVGGKTTMAGDTDFPSELLNYAKGGKTKGYEVFVDFGDEIGTQTIATFDTKKDAFEYRTKVIKNPSNYEDKNSWQGRPSDIKGVYIDSLTSDSYAKGGKTRKSPFKVNDMVYSYQNPNDKMRVSFVRDNGVEDGVDYGWGYKVALKVDEDGNYNPKGKYSQSSKWMSQNSMSKTKKDKYSEGGELMDADTQVDYAKGGEVEYYKDGEPILDTMEKLKMLKPLDDYGYYLEIGNVIHYYDDNKNWETSKLGFAKGGKFASGGNVSYNGWTNYATWVTSLEILDGIDWEEYNMGEPISAEQIEDYVQEVMEQSPNLALSFANRFLNDVNYREIAENANDDFDLDDGEKDEYAKGGQMKKPMIRYSGRR